MSNISWKIKQSYLSFWDRNQKSFNHAKWMMMYALTYSPINRKFITNIFDKLHLKYKLGV
jgi:hypothetical protein